MSDPDKVLMRLGRLSERWPRAWHYVAAKWKEGKLELAVGSAGVAAGGARDGAYLLRTN